MGFIIASIINLVICDLCMVAMCMITQTCPKVNVRMLVFALLFVLKSKELKLFV